jgi:hypothetical protein
MSNNLPYKLEDLINTIDDTHIPAPQKNEVVPNQMISFLNKSLVDKRMIDIQTPIIDMTYGGFPQKGNTLYETPLQRANAFSMPIEKDGLLDKYFSKLQNKIEENKDDLVPEEMKGKIVFQDIIREYENKKTNKIELSLRVRFALTKDHNVETTVWRKEGKDVKEVPIKTVEDLEKVVKYGSKAQFIIRINKFYVSTKNEGTKKDPKYKMGITLKIMAVQIFGSSTTKNVDYKNNYTFDNEEDDVVVDSIDNMSVIDTSKLDEVDEVDEDEDEDE